MAKPKNNSGATTVTRVKANDDKKTAKKPKNTQQSKTSSNSDETATKQNILKKFFGYFKGSWLELKQVRWPNRRATWGMTIALLLFTAFFVLLILVTDIVWENLFKLILE